MVQKKYKDAVALLEQVVKRQPDYELARRNLSIAYLNRALECQNPEEAIFNVHRALALTPDEQGAQKNLSYALQLGKVDVSTFDSRVKYGDSLKEKGDPVGAYVEYVEAMKSKSDSVLQKKIDELVTPEIQANSAKDGGIGAALLFEKIEIDPSKDNAFKFDCMDYERTAERKVESLWKAPSTLGSRKILVGFDTSPDGTISHLKIEKSSGDKVSDAAALSAVKSAEPFKPLAKEVFYTVPIRIWLDARGHESPTYYLNGVAKPNGLEFSTGAQLFPMRPPKDVDAKLQANADAAVNQAGKVAQEIKILEQQFGKDSPKLCPKLLSAAALYTQATEYKLAQDCLTREIQIAQTAKDTNEQAAGLSQVGSLLYTLSKYSDAEPQLKQAIDLYENAESKNIAGLRGALESYAKVLYKLNRVPEGDQIYAKIRTLSSQVSK